MIDDIDGPMVRIRDISLEEMLRCFPNSKCTRENWSLLAGDLYPIQVPVQPIPEICARGGFIYRTGTFTEDGRHVGLCEHIAEITMTIQ